MDDRVLCKECKYSIIEHGYECVGCSNFFQTKIFYCKRCFERINHERLKHEVVFIDNTKITNDLLIHSIIDFETIHLPTTTEQPELFPYNDQGSVAWKNDQFLEISYQLPSSMPLQNSIPFICDYLRMNNSLKYLADKLNLNLCSTDIILLILKYSSFDIRLFIMEQLCMFQRAIPIYFGVAMVEDSSMKYYFLMHEMLHMLLPYKYQNIPIFLSFGTRSCKGKTSLLNAIIKTNFDCHSSGELNFEKASKYYHNQLIQMIISYQYATDKTETKEVASRYFCHVLDLHGNHEWDKMPNFFVEFMSVIIIHMDTGDLDNLDSFPWPCVAHNQHAIYLIFIHGEISEYDMTTKWQTKIKNRFGSNKNNAYVYRANAILNENNQTLQFGIFNLLKTAPIPTKSLLDVSEGFVRRHKLNLSIHANILPKTKQLLNEFNLILKQFSKNNNSSLDLFPLSLLKELSEKSFLKPDEEQQKIQLLQGRHRNELDYAHILLTKLAELFFNNTNPMISFEEAILLLNSVLQQSNQNSSQHLSMSKLESLEMSKDRFLHEFQERSKEYTNLNGIRCLFKDTDQIQRALIRIYQHSFQNQEYIEIINATSSITYPDIFDRAFAKENNDLKNFFVLGIIGEQSSGKSFLVNKIFGTKIAESKFKSTTGILATRVQITGHKSVKNLVILDTEGLLDQSKSTEAQIFDRKMVLAVMARSHIVMINISRNVNKTMQDILEIVVYGLNKLRITNKPKLVFLFRDQDPKSMGEIGQRNHVQEVMDTIRKHFNQANVNMQNIINDFDIHEFPSPFVDLLVGEREITFYNNSFCEKALSLRLKVIDHLAKLESFDSFNEWLKITLELWQQINHNSNLFDFESLIHLTLEKDLETFCNTVLTDANQRMRAIVTNLQNTKQNSVNDIEQKLLQQQDLLTKELDEKLLNERQRLIQNYKLESFPESLYENTKSRIKSSLNMCKIDNFRAATRYFQQDELQKKLSEIPKDLSAKIREIQNVTGNVDQFETLFDDASSHLLANFMQLLENDSRKQSSPLNEELIQNFLRQNQIDDVGVTYFRNGIGDSILIDIVRNVIYGEDSHNIDERSLVLRTTNATSVIQHGSGIVRRFALRIANLFFRNRRNDIYTESEFEKMLSFLKIEYTALKTSAYYNSNILPINEVANYCVKHIREAIKNNEIKDQDKKNMWYTCYGIMLNFFCDDHYKYINKKLIYEFEQEISRRKEEVRQSLVNAATAEEHGQALIQQIWTMIQNGIQKQFQDQFERFFNTWDHYHPTIIAQNCVSRLFRSDNYQAMFDYIKDPTASIKDWLLLRFNEKYKFQLAETILNLTANLDKNKQKFSRMILVWHNAIQVSQPPKTVPYLISCLKDFLVNGQYEKDGISLTETDGGFSMLDSALIREIPETADTHRLLLAIRSTSQTLSNDKNIEDTSKHLINDDQFKNRLFDQFYDKAKGCGTPCPYCKQICNNDNPLHTQHRTDYHLLWVFGGYRRINTETPSLVCCTSNEAFDRRLQSLVDRDIYLPFSEHLQRFNPSWTIINEMTSLEDSLLRAYIALEEELAEYYDFKGRADIEIRKKYIRAIVTTHCYGLLIGIDYENTPNSLDGIPSKDVTCIQQQLIRSSIAHPEKLSILKNDQATKAKILDTLNEIVNNMDQRSTFIFYFSGHGGRTLKPESYLITVDDEKFTARELLAVLRNAKTNKMILIFDSCFSGGMSNAFRFDAKTYKEGIYILCSSKPTEKSYQLKDDDNGFFTKHLIKGLKGEFSCEVHGCRQCANRTQSLREALIHKITSTELVTYLNHAVTGDQQFSLTTINGCDFDISFLDY